MSQVILICLVINQNVIKENNDKVAQEGFEDIIHGCLKRRRSITQAKWHHMELILAVVSSESYFGYTFFLHQNLMITL